VKAADINADGMVVWAKGYASGSPSIVILVNDGSTPYPNFTPNTLEAGSYSVYGVAVGLVNDDRKADVIAGLNNGLYVYYNTSPIDDSLCNPLGTGGENDLSVGERDVKPVPSVANFRVEGKNVILELTAPSDAIDYTLYEVSGRLVSEGRIRGKALRLRVPKAGTYFLRARYDRGRLDFFSRVFVVR